MSSNKPLVPTTQGVVKELISNMEIDKPQASKTKTYLLAMNKKKAWH